jgi:hypothetical protein
MNCAVPVAWTICPLLHTVVREGSIIQRDIIMARALVEHRWCRNLQQIRWPSLAARSPVLVGRMTHCRWISQLPCYFYICETSRHVDDLHYVHWRKPHAACLVASTRHHTLSCVLASLEKVLCMRAHASQNPQRKVDPKLLATTGFLYRGARGVVLHPFN